MSVDTGSVPERFEAALADLDVTVTYTDPAGFDRTLERIAREPAVGTSLPFSSVSLPDWVNGEPTPRSLDSAVTGITAASIGIADYGSVVLPATPAGAEQVSLFPDLHVAVLREADIVANMPTAIARLGPELRDGGSAIIATGPSATADMGSLVRGAHGPKDVHVVVLEPSGERDE
ncbi:LutC/YkgG family protein [Halosolutus halophilus]|uniref:LutC/YkgG family protein n=1 Tax=Halosolutus halophilus TaxID=1552990 RepID=UPI002234FF7D|nr:LUD domain-containing protein [Halosolutus halophilus]